MSFKIGDKVENIQLYNQDKEITDLISDQTGFTLIAFFPGAFTSLCSIGMNQIDAYLDDLEDNKITLVGVSVDSAFALAHWKEQNNINTPEIIFLGAPDKFIHNLGNQSFIRSKLGLN